MKSDEREQAERVNLERTQHFVRLPNRKSVLGRLRWEWEDGIKQMSMALGVVMLSVWMEVEQDRSKWMS